MVRSAATHEDAARMLRKFLSTEALIPLATALQVDHPQLRASLASAQIIGLVMARYVVRMEPLAAADPTAVAASVGRCVQCYLTEDLPLPR
jgi:hypothetical protein